MQDGEEIEIDFVRPIFNNQTDEFTIRNWLNDLVKFEEEMYTHVI